MIEMAGISDISDLTGGNVMNLVDLVLATDPGRFLLKAKKIEILGLFTILSLRETISIALEQMIIDTLGGDPAAWDGLQGNLIKHFLQNIIF